MCRHSVYYCSALGRLWRAVAVAVVVFLLFFTLHKYICTILLYSIFLLIFVDLFIYLFMYLLALKTMHIVLLVVVLHSWQLADKCWHYLLALQRLLGVCLCAIYYDFIFATVSVQSSAQHCCGTIQLNQMINNKNNEHCQQTAKNS